MKLFLRVLWLLGGLGLAWPAAGAANDTPPPPAAATGNAAAAAAPAPIERAPRVYALTVGAAYSFSSRLPLSASGAEVRPWGLQVAGRLGWQVRGFTGGNPASVGFETDFLYQPSSQHRDSYALIYGVFAKHAFLSQRRAHPFFSYGLGAAQVWVREVDGRGIGHATRLAFGVDTRLRERLQLSIALAYQGIIMPNFAIEDAAPRNTSFHGCVLTTGLWFGR